MASVIMLSGPVGAGKTTVAHKLVPLLPSPLSYIEGDKFWSFLAKTDDRGPRDNFVVIMRAMTMAAVPFARSGFDVLLDFSIPPGFLTGARKILKEIPLDYVVLRPSLEVCATRAANRAEGQLADYKPYSDFHSLFVAEERHILSDDNLDAAILAERIREGLGAGQFRIS